MGRPTNADSAVTWDRIVVAAQAEIFENDDGMPDVSLRRVASAAGVSLGTVHYYFLTKEALLEACLDGYYERLAALVGELLTLGAARTPETKAPRDVVSHAVRRIYRFACQERAFLRLRMATNATRGQFHPERQAQIVGPVLDTVVATLGPLVALDADEVRLVVQTVTYVVVRYALASPADLGFITGLGDGVAAERVEEHVVAVATRLLFPRGGNA